MLSEVGDTKIKGRKVVKVSYRGTYRAFVLPSKIAIANERPEGARSSEPLRAKGEVSEGLFRYQPLQTAASW